jgi:hypothetical protein
MSVRSEPRLYARVWSVRSDLIGGDQVPGRPILSKRGER